MAPKVNNQRTPKKDCADTFDVKCMKTEPNSNNSFALRPVSRKQRKKMRRFRKRPADSSFSDSGADDVKVKIHKCDAVSLFNMHSYSELIESLKMTVRSSRQQDIKLEHEGANISPYELQMNDIYNEKIIEPMTRDRTLKLPLPPNTLRSDPPIMEDPYVVKGYLWEKDINNPSISVVDCRIKLTARSFLNSSDFNKGILNKVISDLNRAVKFKEFTNRWNWYGSYLNGSACRDSTIDFHYEPVPESKDIVTKEHHDLLRELRTSLEKDKAFSNVEFSAHVPFPWIRAYHLTAAKYIQITFSNELNSGELRVRNSFLTKLYFDMNPDLKDLTVLLKLVLQKYRIHGNGSGGRINTYTLFWLVVFFMQQKRLLPAVIDIRKSAKIKHHVVGWDCSLPEEFSYSTEPVSLYSLMLGFFDFYRNFDFSKYLVCPYLGSVLLLSDFERLLIPTNEFSVYLRQLQNSRRLTFCRRVINLQDPSNLSFNVAERIQCEYANKFKVVCHHLSDLLPRFMEHIEKMDCFCKLLPNKIDYRDYFPCNLTQYHTLALHTNTDLGFDCHRQKKLNQIYVLDAIRKIMEFVFKFEKKNIVIAQNVSQVVFNSKDESISKRTFPVIYFEYCSSASTWQNSYMKEIIPRNADEKEPIRVNLTCEVCLENELVKLFVQSDVDFIKFLRLYLLKLLRYTLSEIVPS